MLENKDKQLKDLASELRKLGIRGKVVESSYVAPKTVDAYALEQALVRAGWVCVKTGMYYTEWDDMTTISNHHGVYHKDGVEAKVRWGKTTSTLPPTISLYEVKVA